MLSVSIIIEETAGINQHNEPVTAGVLFPKGILIGFMRRLYPNYHRNIMLKPEYSAILYQKIKIPIKIIFLLLKQQLKMMKIQLDSVVRPPKPEPVKNEKEKRSSFG